MDVVNRAALAEAVRRRASGQPLDLIEAALTVGEELTAGADELIGQFVAEARAAGCSWTEIGQRIGVSKQAARQRFVRQIPEEPAGTGADAAAVAGAPRSRRRRPRRPGAIRCSFCGKPEAPGLRLIAGPGVYICAECVRLCNEILTEESGTS